MFDITVFAVHEEYVNTFHFVMFAKRFDSTVALSGDINALHSCYT